MASLLNEEIRKSIEEAEETEELCDKVGVAACAICLKEEGRYTCPRCNARYCSSNCYKSDAHADCSESFYKECFMDGIKDMSASSEEKQNMQQMLYKLEQQQTGPSGDSQDGLHDVEEDDYDEEEDLASRIEGLDLDKDTDAIWNVLTDKEKREFESMIEDGRLGNMIDIWQPWWKSHTVNKIVEITTITKSVVENTPVPKCIKNIPDLKMLLHNSDPSDSICFGVVQALYGYAYITRFHNGEHAMHAKQIWKDIINLVPILKENINYNDVSGAIHASMAILSDAKCKLVVSQKFTVGVIQDVCDLIESPSMTFVIAALSDLHTLLLSALNELQVQVKHAKKSKKNSLVTELRLLRQCCFGCMKKAEFLISWVASDKRHKLAETICSLQVEMHSMTSQFATHDKIKKQLATFKPQNRSKALIEPIS